MSAQDPVPELDALLEFVRDTRGFDFTGYKRSTIQRRVVKRMAELGVESYDEYVDYLQLHAEEFSQLFNTLLINVTGFFRDPTAWEHLSQSIVPQLLEARPPGSPLRVWCAGCASGEEAYTVAMVLARAMGDDSFCQRVKIYATDVDEEALEIARAGAYLPRQIEDVPPGALDRFFERVHQRYVFRKDLRRCVIFGRNDLVQDAPISRIDLLTCRNTLMYFNANTQSQILRRFHFALDDAGVLVLGRSEMLITHQQLFTPVDLNRRVFRKVRGSTRGRVRTRAVEIADGSRQSTTESLLETAFDVGGAVQMVLDAAGALVRASSGARRLFGLGLNDLGRPIQDLELSYRPVELRGALDAVVKNLRPSDISNVHWRLPDGERVFNVHLAPIVNAGVLLGTSITYRDVTDETGLQDQLAESKHALEEAYEELQSTVEELETTNEELQSTNEELQTTIEELQRSNEELETMNDELRMRSLELGDLNAFLERILTTIGFAVAVLDRELHVQVWNGHARELWGLQPEEVEEQHVLLLDFGLPVEQLKEPLRSVLSGASEREEVILDAVNRRGRAFICEVTLLPLSHDGTASGVIMMMQPLDGRLEEPLADLAGA